MDYGLILAIVCCVLGSAYFSATETAFSSLNKNKLKTMIEKEDRRKKRAELVLKLSENYDKLISTILIGNNIVNILASSLGTVFFIKLFAEHGATVSTAVLTIVILIFGEISPKSIAKDMPEKFAMFASPLLNILLIILTPINFLFSQWKKVLSLMFKIEEDTGVTQDELVMMVEEIQDNGNLDVEDGELIKNAIEFNDVEAGDIITHRVDIEGVDVTSDNKFVAKRFMETQFSRLLVYEDNIDKVVGVIHMRDIFTDDGVVETPLKELMSEPLFIQKSEKLNDILRTLQSNKSHIAVVLDEFGGTHGIVTMEDILEELVGEIWDEHDEVVEPIVKISDSTYEVDCSIGIDDFAEKFEIVCETENVSLGGWIMEQLGKIPEEGDKFTYENLDFNITELDSHRVTKVQIKRLEVIVPDEE